VAGYAPLFSSLTTGTLCGRWPDIGLWPIVLSLADKEGVVDVTPAFIAGVTGLALEDVVACMARFCQPDPYSRSNTENGARLVLLDPHRDWGWRIVNFARYREKARLAAKAAREVESGVNRSRMGDRRGPPETAGDRPSNANANSDRKKDPPTPQGGPGEEAHGASTAMPPGLDPAAWERFLAYRHAIRKPIKPASLLAAQRKLAGFGRDQAAVVEQSVANGWQGLFPLDQPRPAAGPRPAPVSAVDRVRQATGVDLRTFGAAPSEHPGATPLRVIGGGNG
jgi:hypothetical protein